MEINEVKYVITFAIKGFVICDSYEKRENGVYWKHGSLQGFATNDQIKMIEPYES